MTKLLILAMIILFCDFVSKDLTQTFIPDMRYASVFFPYGGLAIFENWHGIAFSINFVTNLGGAWNILEERHSFLLILRIIAVSIMMIYVFGFHLMSRKAYPLMMIIAGAVGNVIDCFTYGKVIDMIHFNFWGYSFPIFNLADSFIFIGVCILIIQYFYARFEVRMRAKFEATPLPEDVK